MPLINTLPAIVSTLKKIVEIDHDSRTKSKANGLLRKVCAFEFILCLSVLLDHFVIHKKFV